MARVAVWRVVVASTVCWLPAAHAEDIEFHIEGIIHPTEENVAFLEGIGATEATWSVTGVGRLFKPSRYSFDADSVSGTFGGLETVPSPFLAGGFADVGTVTGQLSGLGFPFGFIEGCDFRFSMDLLLPDGTSPFLKWKGIGLFPLGTLASTPPGEAITDFFPNTNFFELQTAFNDTLATGEITSLSVRFIPGVGTSAVFGAAGFAMSASRRRRIGGS